MNDSLLDRAISVIMRHISYSSIANDLTQADYRALVADAQAKNAERGVRGVIAYDGRIITQILEGEPDAVDQLFRKIRLDPRHSGVVLTTRADITKSRFDTFGMANLSPSEVYLMSSAIVDRYGEGDTAEVPLVLA